MERFVERTTGGVWSQSWLNETRATTYPIRKSYSRAPVSISIGGHGGTEILCGREEDEKWRESLTVIPLGFCREQLARSPDGGKGEDYGSTSNVRSSGAKRSGPRTFVELSSLSSQKVLKEHTVVSGARGIDSITATHRQVDRPLLRQIPQPVPQP